MVSSSSAHPINHMIHFCRFLCLCAEFSQLFLTCECYVYISDLAVVSIAHFEHWTVLDSHVILTDITIWAWMSFPKYGRLLDVNLCSRVISVTAEKLQWIDLNRWCFDLLSDKQQIPICPACGGSMDSLVCSIVHCPPLRVCLVGVMSQKHAHFVPSYGRYLVQRLNMMPPVDHGWKSVGLALHVHMCMLLYWCLVFCDICYGWHWYRVESACNFQSYNKYSVTCVINLLLCC